MGRITNIEPFEPMHLGDGAYMSWDARGIGIILTANHHDPRQATDRVFIDSGDVPRLIKELQNILEAPSQS